MWQSLTDNIPTVAAFATASLGVLGAALKRGWRPHPRRVLYAAAGLFATSKERELALWTVHQWRERAESEMEWGRYWKTQLDQCRNELTDCRSRQP